MSEPLEGAVPRSPTLASLLEDARSLAIRLAEYRVSGSILPSESPNIENAEASARSIHDDLRGMISARTNQAALGG